MTTLSFSEYNNEIDVYALARYLTDIKIPRKHFIKASILILKSIQHLINEECRRISVASIKMAEKYLRGKATIADCKRAIFYTEKGGFQSCSTPTIAVISNSPAASYALTVEDFCILTKTDASAIFREYFSWNLVCGFQIAKALSKSSNESFVKELAENQQLIQYATVILEDQNLKQEFKFLMKDYMSKTL